LVRCFSLWRSADGVRAAASRAPLTPLSSGRDARLEGLVLSLPGPIDKQSAEQARTGADTGAEPGIATDRANYRAAAGADGRAGQRALLGWGHIGACSGRKRDGREQQ
jgi:hypothetical protein